MEAVTFAATVVVLMGKEPYVFPGWISINPSTIAAGLLLAVSTCSPPEGATPFRYTVAVVEVPPGTVLGEINKLEGVGARTVSTPKADPPNADARMGTLVSCETGVVKTGKYAVIWPA